MVFCQNKIITKNCTKNIIVCIPTFSVYRMILVHNDIHPYLPIPKLSPDTNYITESHNIGVTVTNSYIKCLVDNGNYIGIGNIKLLFFTKYPLESTSVINLIRKIKLRAEGFEIGWYKINLMIMQKLNRIRLSEIFYEVNKSWCYEINIHFNTVENWLPTLRNKNNSHRNRFLEELSI